MSRTVVRNRLPGIVHRLRGGGMPLPCHCVVCEFPLFSTLSLCDYCRSRLPWTGRCCSLCGVPLPDRLATASCGRCILSPPPFDCCNALFHYRAPVNGMIGRFKFRGDFACGRVIGNLLAERFSCYYSGPAPHDADRRPPHLLVPVPLHRRRLRSRGFNQALELARVVSRRCDITLAGDLVRKTRETAPQSQLSATGRVHNLRGAFTVAGVPHAENRLRVALIDDVVTTGSTARALAAVLKRAGISRVDVWAVSRAA